MTERPRPECGMQDHGATLSPYSTINAMGLNPDAIQVGASGGAATSSSSPRISHHETSIPIFDRITAGMEFLKEIRALRSGSDQNSKDLQAIKEEATNLMVGISEDYQQCPDKRAWPPPQIKGEVLDFLSFLDGIREVVDQLQQKGKFSAMIHSRNTTKQIKEIKESTSVSLSGLKIRSLLAIGHIIGQIDKSQKEMMANQTSSLGDFVVNDANNLTDSKFPEIRHFEYRGADPQHLDTPDPNAKAQIFGEYGDYEEQALPRRQELASLPMVLDKREEARNEPQGIPEDHERMHEKGRDLVVEESRVEQQRGCDAERIRKPEDGRPFPMEESKVADLEVRLRNLAVDSSREQAKIEALENNIDVVPLTHSKKTMVGVKKAKKKSDRPASATPSGNMESGSSHAFPTQVHSSSHPVTAPPYYPHYGATTSYGPPWAYNSFNPVYPPMGADMMFPGYYDAQSPFGQPLPQATVNNINSGNVSNVRISNVGNNNHGTAHMHSKRNK